MESRKTLAVTTTLGVLTISTLVTSCARRQAVDLGTLLRDAQQIMEIVENPLTRRPSFIRTLLSLETLGLAPTDTTGDVVVAFVNRYAGLFGIADAQRDLQYVHTDTDPLGMRHITVKQVFEGIDVYAAWVTLHLSPDGAQVAVVSNSAVPDVRVPTTQPTLDADSALTLAQSFLPGGTSVSSSLAVYPGARRQGSANLAWMVELRDDAVPARKVYVIDALDGEVLDSLDRFYTSRDRRTHTASNGTSLPGTLVRSEGDGPAGDQDVDDAHDFAGDTYDYFFNTHGRDSYDDAGATLVSTAHYATNYQNAGWTGTQMLYGDGFAVKDVAAHELAHAVTERTADLEYRAQSGALNESFSDIFGAMVDRDDWLIGEDLPGGAIRDLSDPPRFNHPDHTNDWLVTCSDNEGVHTNSGITNKAFFNIATAIGKDSAERIFYRALTVLLMHQPQASLEDARSAALQAAADLFGNGSAESQAVNSGFAAVGLNGSWQPSSSCGQVPDMSVLGLVLLALVVILLALFGRRPVLARR